MRKILVIAVLVVLLCASVVEAAAAARRSAPMRPSSQGQQIAAPPAGPASAQQAVARPQAVQNRDPQHECNKEQSKEPEEKKCDPDKLRKEEGQTQDGIKPFKDEKDLDKQNIPGSNGGGNREAKDVCAYNKGCEEVAEKYPDYYKEEMKKCCDTPSQSAKCVPPDPNNPSIVICTFQGCAGASHKGGPAQESTAKQMANRDCHKNSQEQKQCNEKASERANKDGKDKVKEKHQIDQKPKGSEITRKQAQHCKDIIINDKDPGLADLHKLTDDQLNDGMTAADRRSIGAKFATQSGGLSDRQMYCLAKNSPDGKNMADLREGMKPDEARLDKLSDDQRTAATHEMIKRAPPSQASPSNPAGGPTDAVNAPRTPYEEAVALKQMEIAGQKEVAGINAAAQVKSAEIGAAGQIASAAIGALAQLAGQKDSGGQQGGQSGTELKAPETGATAEMNQFPAGAIAESTPNCVGLTSPTDAQIQTCERLGFRMNGGVMVPIDQVTMANNNPSSGPSLLVPVSGGLPGATVEQAVNIGPGAVVETTINPGGSGQYATGGAVFAPIRIRDAISEDVVIGDYRTATVIRYPEDSTADKPPVINWFTGASLYSGLPAFSPRYQRQSLPDAVINYQVGGSDLPGAQTINVGQISGSIVKIVPNIHSARVDMKGDHSMISAIVNDGYWRGSSLMASLTDNGVRSKKNYLLSSLYGPSYIVTGPYVKVQDGGKIIQSSLRVGPDTISPQQCEVVYGRPCR